MNALQRRIRGLLSAEAMTFQGVIDAFTPLGIKASDIKRAVRDLVFSGDVNSTHPYLLGDPAEVMLTLASMN